MTTTGRGAVSISAGYRMARAKDPGGGPFTRTISSPLGSWAAAVGIRFGLHPSVVTLASLLLGVAASVVVIVGAGGAQPWWAPGWVAFLGWQVAYVLDCADGQIARATGRASEHGARLDVLVDYATHSSIVCSLVAVVAVTSPVPVVLLALAATLWFASTFTAVLKRSDSAVGQSFVHGRSLLAEAVRTAGDNGAVLFLVGGWLLVHPSSVGVPVAALTLLNGCYLLAFLVREARRSMRGHDVRR
jgi:phosphatidylglycerophosphate synthase